MSLKEKILSPLIESLMVETYFLQDQVLSFSDGKFLCNVESDERVLMLHKRNEAYPLMYVIRVQFSSQTSQCPMQLSSPSEPEASPREWF